MNTKELGGYQVLQESEKRPAVLTEKAAFQRWHGAPELAVEVGIISGFNNS
jgi:hypothetical protein